jgi:hypothetical protein
MNRKFVASLLSLIIIATLLLVGTPAQARTPTTQSSAPAAALRAAADTFSHPNDASSPLSGNIVSEWNAIAQEVLQPTPMPGMPMPMASMSASFVYLAYTQIAVYDALLAIEGGYKPYAYTAPAPNPQASREAAVATAAYTVLKHFFPLDHTLDGKYIDSMATIPNGQAKLDGIAIGTAAANAIIALRAGDILAGDGGYTVPPPGPGVWQPTLMMPDGVTPAAPVDPWMANLKPFLRADPAQYDPGPPPALDDPQYLADLAEVKDVGGAMSATRTPEQTATANFWGTNMVIQAQTSYRTAAQAHSLSLLDTARLMAMGNTVATDSLIATFNAKYGYSFWRPVTAIQHTKPDGSYSASPLSAWMPAMMTPNFPEYVAGHGSFVSSQAEVFTQFYGTPQIELDLISTATGTTRHYATADQMRTEVVNARTWGGMHFRTSTLKSVSIGQKLVLDSRETWKKTRFSIYLPLIAR